jgi:hypothetical protein
MNSSAMSVYFTHISLASLYDTANHNVTRPYTHRRTLTCPTRPGLMSVREAIVRPVSAGLERPIRRLDERVVRDANVVVSAFYGPPPEGDCPCGSGLQASRCHRAKDGSWIAEAPPPFADRAAHRLREPTLLRPRQQRLRRGTHPRALHHRRLGKVPLNLGVIVQVAIVGVVITAGKQP